MKMIIIILAMALVGCGGSESPTSVGVAKTQKKVSSTPYGKISVVKVDGCEYLFYHASRASSMIHKANCKNH